jgi:hypothetical protein
MYAGILVFRKIFILLINANSFFTTSLNVPLILGVTN